MLGLGWLASLNRGDRLRLGVLVVLMTGSLATVERWPVLLTVSATFGLLPVVQDARTMAQARRRVGELVAALRSAPTDPAETLRERLSEPTLEIYYRVDASPALVDRRGRAEPSPAQGVTVTRISAAGGLRAHVHHRAGVPLAEPVTQALGGSAWLSLEIGRLSGVVAVRADQLREARHRIVMRADRERRELERDVHDGAQQHLLALGMGLRTAQLCQPDEVQAKALLDWCGARTAAALDDLREVAHGIYPNALASSGLDHALRGLVRRADRAVTLEITSPIATDQLSPDVERTAYIVASDAIARSHGSLQIRVDASEQWLDMRIDGGLSEASHILADRVAAVGGILTHIETQWKVVLPCAPSSLKIS